MTADGAIPGSRRRAGEGGSSSLVVPSRLRAGERAAELASRGRLVVVAGAAGSGRTTVLEVAAAAHDGPTLRSGGVASLGHVAVLPLSRALRDHVPTDDTTGAARFVVERAGRGTLLVVDDLELCDAETVEVIRALVGQLPVVVSVADDHGHGRGLAARLAACPGVERIDLDPLGDEEAGALVAARCGSGPVPLGRILVHAGGNAAALVALAEEPSAPTHAAAVARRLTRIDPASRTVLSALTVLGRPAPVDLLGRAAVATAVADGVVSVAIGEGGVEDVRIRSRFDGEVALALCSEEARAGIHRYLAGRLPDAEAVPHHERAGDRDAAAACARRALATTSDPIGSVRLRATLARLDGGEDRVERCLDLAVAASDLGAHQLATRLVEDSGRVGDPRASVVAARAALVAGDARSALAALDGAEGWPTGAVRTWAELERGRALCLLDPEAAVGAARALVGASAAPHGRARAQALLGAALLAAGCPGWEEALVSAEERARSIALTDVALAARANRCAGLIRHGRGDAAAVLAREAVAESEDAGALGWSAHFAAIVLWVRLHVDGAVEEARTMGEALLDDALPPLVRSEVGAQVALAHGDAGRHETARAVLDGVGTSTDLARWCDAELHAVAGRPEHAGPIAVEVASDARRWPVGSLARVTAAWASRDLDRPDGGPRGSSSAIDDGVGGAGLELRAIDRSCPPATAARSFSEAALAWMPFSRRSALRCRAAAAVARAADDPEAALVELRAVGEAAADSGLVVIAARAARERRRMGDPSARVVGRDRAGPGLTAREAEVLALVGDGLTSAAIARRLSIAPSTVETHVQASMRKLGASTRTEAAVRAVEAWA